MKPLKAEEFTPEGKGGLACVACSEYDGMGSLCGGGGGG